jgi:hypothetical protein
MKTRDQLRASPTGLPERVGGTATMRLIRLQSLSGGLCTPSVFEFDSDDRIEVYVYSDKRIFDSVRNPAPVVHPLAI